MSLDSPPAPLRVVVVDDTVDLRDLLRFALHRYGFTVVAEAGDGREGIDVVTELQPDLILLDMAMPVMDGLEALPHMRRACPDAKIVVLSGFGAADMTRRAVAAGADGYLQKGAPISRIIQYVREITEADDEPAIAAPTPPNLSVVREPAGPGPVPPVSASQGHAVAQPVSADHLDEELPGARELAPFAIVEIEDAPALRIVSANAAATALLGPGCVPEARLAEVDPGLADLVAFHRLQDGAVLEVAASGSGPGRTFRLRRSGRSLFLYAESSEDESARLRRALAATAHEIRNPVAVIMGVVESIAASAESMEPVQHRRLLESLDRQARLLDGVSATLVTSAQARTGTLRADLAEVAPGDVIARVLEQRDRVRLSIDDPRPVLADAHRLAQMLENLLSNAEKYGAAPYAVRVRSGGEYVYIDVEDSGAGVPPEFRDHLFEEFSRVEDIAVPGTGLGLYVVRSLAEAQGGRATYAPGPFGGSVFTLTLRAG